jgi:hypothetical protein
MVNFWVIGSNSRASNYLYLLETIGKSLLDCRMNFCYIYPMEKRRKIMEEKLFLFHPVMTPVYI